MDSPIRRIECGQHGEQDATFVCQHVVQGLVEGVPYGFWWAADDLENPRPDAWCTECNEWLAAADGEWTDRNVEQAKIQVLCGCCYDQARGMNLRRSLGARVLAFFGKR